MISSKLQEIETAIESLPPRDLAELYSWVDQRATQPIDSRMEADLAAGSLDKAILTALKAEKNGEVSPL